MTVDGKDLERLRAYGRGYKAFLNASDAEKLDYKLALTYELQSFVSKENEKEVKHEVENIVQYIDSDVREKVNSIIKLVNDPVSVKLLQDLINIDLIGEISRGYHL